MAMNAPAAREVRAPGPVFLRGGFRLLFLLGATWALVVAALWIAAFGGHLILPTAMDPLAWHQHEMLFGYLSAVVGGFLTAAIPNWTGRPALSGWPVAGLVGCWIGARVAILFSSHVPPLVGWTFDIGFLLILFVYATREVFAAGNRNKPVLVVVVLFGTAAAVDHGHALGWFDDGGAGMRAGFALVLLLIALIGGRIIPAFTRNWLTAQRPGSRLPAAADRIDHAALIALGVALLAWVFEPIEHATAILLILAGALHLLRLSRWSGWQTWRAPMVLILHLSYFWLPLGLLLLGASILGTVVPGSSAVHALAAGAMGSMTLAVMTRATRGHTGRPLVADKTTVAIYALVLLGAALRVVAPLLPDIYLISVEMAGAAWGGAFLLFIIVYGPMLLGPRADGKP